MNHHPYLTLSDKTEITYSDIKEKGQIVFYCETPDEKVGSKNARIDYPFTSQGFYDIFGYSDEELEKLRLLITNIAEIAYRRAVLYSKTDKKDLKDILKTMEEFSSQTIHFHNI